MAIGAPWLGGLDDAGACGGHEECQPSRPCPADAQVWALAMLGRVRTSERDRGLRGGQGRVGETCSGGCSLSGQDRLGMKDLGWPAGSPVCWVEMGFQTEHLRWAVCEAEALRAPG